MDALNEAVSPEEEQESRLAMEEACAVCEAASAVLGDDEKKATMLSRLYYGDDEDAFCQLMVEYPDVYLGGKVCFWQWVLGSAVLGPEGAGTAPIEILRRLEAPVLRGPMGEFVEEMCASRLSLYEVQAVDGRRVQLLDMLAPGAEPVWATTYGSQISFVPWTISGLRILASGRGFRTAVAVHFFSREAGLALARLLRRNVRYNARLAQPRPWGLVVDFAIFRRWFDYVLGRQVEEDAMPALDLSCLEEEGGEEALRSRLLAWTAQPHELLGGRTPAHVAKLKRDRVMAVNLLKSFEHQNAIQVRDEEGRPFSFRFLWEELGLDPSMSSL